jgi:membrane associated rhomboid family serine protease
MFLELNQTMRSFPLKELLSVIKYPMLFLVIIWLIFWADNYWNLDLYLFGVNPRTLSGLKGILFAPLIHGDLNHTLNNSLPVLILGSMIFYFYKPIAWPSILWIYLVSGLWLWVGGRNNDVIPNYHFGASTLIYGFSTFLFFSGVFRKHKQLMMVSAFVVFTYGSITWGIFPIDRTMSWEGHLFGSISGILVAYSYRKDGPQPIPYQWPEEEIDLEAIANQELLEEQNTAQIQVDLQNDKPSLDPFQIVYHFKESNVSKPSETKE